MIGMAKGTFTRHKLNMYFDDDTSNWVGARRIINGSDKANLIAGYAIKFYDALQYKENLNDGDNPEDVEKPDLTMENQEKANPLIVEINGEKYVSGSGG
jgi:hypothetical protein